jgi:hypothetical protein
MQNILSTAGNMFARRRKSGSLQVPFVGTKMQNGNAVLIEEIKSAGSLSEFLAAPEGLGCVHRFAAILGPDRVRAGAFPWNGIRPAKAEAVNLVHETALCVFTRKWRTSEAFGGLSQRIYFAKVHRWSTRES